MKKIRLSEQQLNKIVLNCAKRLIREGYYSGGEYYDYSEQMYIGRTEAYYDDDEDSVFAPDYWTYSEDPNDKDFAGEVYQLTDEGIKTLEWWLNCRRSNEYQRGNTFNGDYSNPEQMWDRLTSDSELSTPLD